jgi:DNA uptake protein ComE-like DNA-binding protein
MATLDSETHERSSGYPRVDSCLLILVVLWVMAASAVVPKLIAPATVSLWATPSARIDPNTAHWWELSALPRIGMTSAEGIIRYRESATTNTPPQDPTAAFYSANDLTRVKGIGPKTAGRINPFLTFPNRPDRKRRRPE